MPKGSGRREGTGVAVVVVVAAADVELGTVDDWGASHVVSGWGRRGSRRRGNIRWKGSLDGIWHVGLRRGSLLRMGRDGNVVERYGYLSWGYCDMKRCLVLGDCRTWMTVCGRRDPKAAVVGAAVVAEVVAGHPQKVCGFVDHLGDTGVFEMLVRCRR